MKKNMVSQQEHVIECLDEDGWHVVEKHTPSKRKKKYWISAFCFLLILVPFVSFTYSSYVTKAKGDPKLNVAPWKFRINSIGATKLDIDLADTLTSNNYSMTSVVPGTQGKIVLEVDCSSTKVATEYTISLDSLNTLVPTTLKFYSDQAMTQEFSFFQGDILLKDIDRPVTKVIYWKWEYTATDETLAWTNKEIKLGLVANAKQKVN